MAIALCALAKPIAFGIFNNSQSVYKMNRYHHWKKLSLIGISIMGTSLLSSCHSVDPAANASQPEVVSVELATVKNGTIRDSSEFVAQLESRQSVILQPRVEGQIERIFVRAGDLVKAGTPIMQIDAREQLASVESRASEVDSARANMQRTYANKQQAKANLSRSLATLKNAEANLKTLEADLRKAQAELRFNQGQYQRYQQVYAEGAISSQDVNQYKNSLDIAQAELEAVEAEIQAQKSEIESHRASINAQQAEVTAQKAELVRAERQIQQAQANTQEQEARLDYYSITAPLTGKIGNIPVKEGDFVDTDTKLAQLAQNEVLEVNVSIPVNRALDIDLGTKIELLNAQNQVVGISRVFFIAPNVANGSQLVLVKARLDNAEGKLRADEFIRARVIWEERGGLKVPTTAISRIAGQNFVFVTEQSETGLVARQKPVQLGNIQGNYYQVLEGLKPNEQIAVTGLLQLYDGAAIAPKS